jgi:hypothetical protein
MKQFIRFFLLLSLSAIFACRDHEQVDILPPTIEAIYLDDVPVSSITIEQGTTHTIAIQASDNKSIATIRYVATANETFPNPNFGTWDLQGTQQVDGNSDLYEYTITAPDSISMAMNIVFTVTDDNGYQDQVTMLLQVTNAQKPTITGTTIPAANSEDLITLNDGDNLLVSGEATDPDGLSSLKVMLWDMNNNIISSSDISITGNPQSFSNASFDNAVVGQFRVVIQAIDLTGQVSLWGRFITVN